MWFVIDALGIAFCVVTWLVILFVDVVVVRFVLATWFWTETPSIALVPFTGFGTCLFAGYQTLMALSWFSHLQAIITDPGTIRQSEAPAEIQDPRVCKICSKWKPPRAHHCKVCQKCIFRMDHHCPWINNCVGLGNQKLFILFMVYTIAAAIVTLLLLFFSAIYWLAEQSSWSDAAPPSSVALIMSGVASVMCIAVILFAGDFLKEQVESIEMNSTLVETYQRTHGVRTTTREHFESVFGHQWYVWPLPWPSAPGPFYDEVAVPDEDAPLNAFEVYGENDLGIVGAESEVPLRMPAQDAPTPEGMRPRQRFDREES